MNTTGNNVVSPPELNITNLDLPSPEGRRELKYIIPRRSGLFEDRAITRLCPTLRQSYDPRMVCNLYLDTPSLSCFGDNLSGVSNRFKLRVRWYGKAENPINPRMERKIRSNQLSWKESCPLPEIDFDMRWTEMFRILQGAITPNLREWFLACRQPVLLNCYRRQYYESSDGNVRVTVDTGIRFYDQRFAAKPNIHLRDYRLDTPVLELKFAPQYRQIALRTIRPLRLRQSRFSKYSIGVECLLSRGRDQYL